MHHPHSTFWTRLTGNGCCRFLFVSTVHAIQAPLKAHENAQAIAFMVYLRTIAGVSPHTGPLPRYDDRYGLPLVQVWGIAIGASVLQNQLAPRVPPSFYRDWWGIGVSGERNAAWMYGVAASVRTISGPTHSQLQYAFKESLQVVWIVIGTIAGVGLVSSFLMQPVPLQDHMRGGWQFMQAEDKVELEDVSRRADEQA